MYQDCKPFENEIKILKSFIIDVIKYNKSRKIKHNIINIDISFEDLTSSSEKDNDIQNNVSDNDILDKLDDITKKQYIPKIESISIYDKDYSQIFNLNNKTLLCSIDIFPKTRYKNYIFRYKTKYYLIYELDSIYYYKKISFTKLNKLIKTIILF
jgi:hypothetical protein